MRLKPENLFDQNSLASAYLLYGNNDPVIDYLSGSLFPQKLSASVREIEYLEESKILEISKTSLYTNSSLFNPKKLVVIRGVTDKLLPLVEGYAGDLPLVLLGKSLRANSKLVQFMQGHKSYGSVSIYGDEPQLLRAYFRYVFREYRPDNKILDALASAATFSEARRLVPLLSQLCVNMGEIKLDHIHQLSTQYQFSEIFGLVSAVLGKQPRRLVELLQLNKGRVEKELIPLLRLIAKQVWELIDLLSETLKGTSAVQAVKQAVPKIPFPRHSEVIANLSRWKVSALLNMLLMLDEVEAMYKQQKQFCWSNIERVFLKMCKL